MYKFLSAKEHELFQLIQPDKDRIPFATLLWSAKESIFKWYGDGGVDFRREIQLKKQHAENERFDSLFSKNNTRSFLFITGSSNIWCSPGS